MNICTLQRLWKIKVQGRKEKSVLSSSLYTYTHKHAHTNWNQSLCMFNLGLSILAPMIHLNHQGLVRIATFHNFYNFIWLNTYLSILLESRIHWTTGGSSRIKWCCGILIPRLKSRITIPKWLRHFWRLRSSWSWRWSRVRSGVRSRTTCWWGKHI